MPPLRFAKYHGLGNDFVLLDHRTEGGLVGAELAKRLCDRHRGIGADGVLSLLPSRTAEASLRLHIWNSDGSEAEMCGNGLRCVVRYVLARDGGEVLRVDTDAGLRTGQFEVDGRVRVTLGVPVLGPELRFETEDRSLIGRVIHIGNPHFVLAPFEQGGLRDLAMRLGPWIQAQAAFPAGTNVEFFRSEADALELWVYERGAGLTEACGTGAAATVVALDAAHGLGGSNRRKVRLPGGLLDVELERDERGGITQVAIIGEAVRVFEGTWVC